MLFQGDFWGNITFQKVQHYSDSIFIALEVSGVSGTDLKFSAQAGLGNGR